MTDLVEQQARRLLRLFPAWMRADRGEEALGLVLDLVPAGATRLPWRSRWDLARAGLHARRRAIPPWSVWIEVLSADPRNNRGLIPAEWRPWLVHWLGQPRWRLRLGATWFAATFAALAVMAPALIAARQSLSIDPMVGLYPLAFSAFKAGATGPKWRWSAAVRNGMEPDGLRPFPPGTTLLGVTRPVVADRPARPFLVFGLLASVAVASTAAIVAATATSSDPVLGGSAERVLWVLAMLAGGGVAVAFARKTSRLVSVAPAAPPAPRDPASYVSRPAWHRRAQLMGVAAYGVASVVASFIIVAAGRIGLATALAGVGAWSWILVQAVRRERAIGRRLGLWEVAPTLGPLPLLLVRKGVIERPSPAWMAPSGRDHLA